MTFSAGMSLRNYSPWLAPFQEFPPTFRNSDTSLFSSPGCRGTTDSNPTKVSSSSRGVAHTYKDLPPCEVVRLPIFIKRSFVTKSDTPWFKGDRISRVRYLKRELSRGVDVEHKGDNKKRLTQRGVVGT